MVTIYDVPKLGVFYLLPARTCYLGISPTRHVGGSSSRVDWFKYKKLRSDVGIFEQ